MIVRTLLLLMAIITSFFFGDFPSRSSFYSPSSIMDFNPLSPMQREIYFHSVPAIDNFYQIYLRGSVNLVSASNSQLNKGITQGKVVLSLLSNMFHEVPSPKSISFNLQPPLRKLFFTLAPKKSASMQMLVIGEKLWTAFNSSNFYFPLYNLFYRRNHISMRNRSNRYRGSCMTSPTRK